MNKKNTKNKKTPQQKRPQHKTKTPSTLEKK